MGGQRNIALFNEYVSKRVTFTCVGVQNNEVAAASYNIIPLFSNKIWRYINPAYFFRIRTIIRQKQITHLIIEHPYYGWLGTLLRWFCGSKLIVHSHNLEYQRFKSIGKWWWYLLYQYEKFTHRKAQHSFFITEEDRLSAIARFGLKAALCTTVTYGIDWNSIPSAGEKQAAKKTVESLLGIPVGCKLFLFNGTLTYKPNQDALRVILQEINPRLQRYAGSSDYRIVICGKGLPPEYLALPEFKEAHIVYAGFVDDISMYYKATNVFLNPVVDGGGIKTKLVEALAYNCDAVSTVNGAIGIPKELCDGKLIVTNDWDAFAKAVLAMHAQYNTTAAYFDHFYWENIAAKAVAAIKSV
jgi:glycosyltransferase involved in cell wall biosynthesis